MGIQRGSIPLTGCGPCVRVNPASEAGPNEARRAEGSSGRGVPLYSAFQRTFHRVPDYPAAQAFAIGVVLTDCLRRAASLGDESLLRAAHALKTTTLYGRFRLDPLTSRQIGHRVLLVQWRDGRKVVISGR
jgi:hypothetical protein